MVLPDTYVGLPEEEVFARIARTKAQLGERLVILGHHYQRDEVIQFADYRGDSLGLSRRAAEAKDAQYIVFCGVDFMAETAAMLCAPGQVVLIPDPHARCPMAAMADVSDAMLAWEHLVSLWGNDLVPITYQNSYAELKAFCGKHNGAVCTSSNAQSIFQRALGEKGHLLFFPDEHLGRNTALALGIPAHQIAVWDPHVFGAGPELKSGPAMAQAKVVVWKGYCHVHTHFKAKHVQTVRAKYEDITVVVHPECTAEVVARSELNGSTAFIVKTVEAASAEAKLAIGTEINLVARLAKEHPGKTVIPLARSLCGAMYRINPSNLLYVLEGLLEGELRNVVKVPEETARWANLALGKMLGS